MTAVHASVVLILDLEFELLVVAGSSDLVAPSKEVECWALRVTRL
jgi:hypothetical protein